MTDNAGLRFPVRAPLEAPGLLPRGFGERYERSHGLERGPVDIIQPSDYFQFGIVF
jgi:hypothetical protein